MLAAVEYRFGQVNRLPVTIEWLSDNGSCYVAGDTRTQHIRPVVRAEAAHAIRPGRLRSLSHR